MNYYLQQTIQIRFIKIGGMTNSSVLQIGACGQINSRSYLYNTGGFTEPAPAAKKSGEEGTAQAGGPSASPLVPLQSPGTV
ncbi:spore germination protein GerPB [Rossellomorea aquimaris]|jgi:spore germination protein PB|uniref:Spore gernimation protein n=1 Tax=Rossellomorea aquimaris TaxID=189382 RepID=A0A1J6WXH3_9BACI|nr:spore germination protein GerPB [Rossellomorea aquimaris]OIU72551.1 spore gernimation protein [Rossellomorea aquimaris]